MIVAPGFVAPPRAQKRASALKQKRRTLDPWVDCCFHRTIMCPETGKRDGAKKEPGTLESVLHWFREDDLERRVLKEGNAVSRTPAEG